MEHEKQKSEPTPAVPTTHDRVAEVPPKEEKQTNEFLQFSMHENSVYPEVCIFKACLLGKCHPNTITYRARKFFHHGIEKSLPKFEAIISQITEKQLGDNIYGLYTKYGATYTATRDYELAAFYKRRAKRGLPTARLFELLLDTPSELINATFPVPGDLELVRERSRWLKVASSLRKDIHYALLRRKMCVIQKAARECMVDPEVFASLVDIEY